MYYQITHTTRFRYSQPISESVIELHMQPRTEGTQRCLLFRLITHPPARATAYTDYLGNTIHFFDIPGRHVHLTIRAESVVEIQPPSLLPEALDNDAWDVLDKISEAGNYWDMLTPSDRTQPTPLLNTFAREIAAERGADPLTLLKQINSRVYHAFEYDPDSTHVHSPIDDALRARRGVCQDLAHIMIALVRQLGIPCRYVSGYLFYQRDHHDRSTPDASHAWLEAYLPSLGWIGFDPTNNLLAGERHIRVAVGRDYNDVPPTRGIFKGTAESELEVAVHVKQTSASALEALFPSLGWQPAAEEIPPLSTQQMQQQQ